MSSNPRFFRTFILISLLSLAALTGTRESGAGELTATWLDNSSNEVGFAIERRAGTTQTYNQIATVAANITSYNDSGLVDGDTYCYRVFAFNTAGRSPYSNEMCASAGLGANVSLLAAVLPSSRSVRVGVAATVFATVINVSSTTAIQCGITLLTNIPVVTLFQTTNPLTNQLTGTPNTPVSIPAGATQSFVLSFTPTQTFAPTDAQMSFDCANTFPAPINTGLNTVLLSASATPVPDIVALAATSTNDGIANIPGTNGTGAFAVATANVGASGNITASADTGNAALPVSIFLCQTNPVSGQCISAINTSVPTQINANATPTFGIFVRSNGNVPFDPATNRIFVRFKDGGGITRGSTSVAVRTQ